MKEAAASEAAASPGEVWTPRRVPSGPQVRQWVRSGLTRDEETLGPMLARLTSPQRHLLAAAHHGASMVVVGAQGDDGASALAAGAALAARAGHSAVLVADAGNVASQAGPLAEALSVRFVPSALAFAPGFDWGGGAEATRWFVEGLDAVPEPGLSRLLEQVGRGGALVGLCEPGAGGRVLAERVARAQGRCGYVEAVEWDQVRTRVFAPFRNEPCPEPEALALALRGERERAAAAGEHTAYAAEMTPVAWARALGRLASEPRIGVLLCRDARECLRGLLIADAVRRGRFEADEEAALAASAERVMTGARAMRVRSRERAIYSVLSALPCNRGNASAIVAMVERGG